MPVVGYWNRLPREWSRKAARAQRLFGQHSQEWGLGGRVGPGIELDICGSLPTLDIPCFMEITIHAWLGQNMCNRQVSQILFFNQVLPSPCPRQVRSYYVDWRMLRDVKRRKMAFEHADERLRINAIRKNSILPKELQVRAAGSAQPWTHMWPLLPWCAQGHSSHFIDPNGCPRSQMLCFLSSQAQNYVMFYSDFSLLGGFTTTTHSSDWRLCKLGCRAFWN